MKKLKIVLIISLLIFFLGISFVISSLLQRQEEQAPERSEASMPNTILVCPGDDPNDECDFDGKDYPNDNGKAIQSAIDNAEDGDKILLKSGIYIIGTKQSYQDEYYFADENPVVDVSVGLIVKEKEVRIMAEDYQNTVINFNKSQYGFLLDNAKNTTLEGLTMIGVAGDKDNTVHESVVVIKKGETSLNTVEIRNCNIKDNNTSITQEVEPNIKGLLLVKNAKANFINSVITDTPSYAIATWESSELDVINSIIANTNKATRFSDKSVTHIRNSIIAHNNTNIDFAAGILAWEEAVVNVSYTLLFDNEKGDFQSGGNAKINKGEGIVHSDPLFSGDDDLHLKPDSPAINAGDPDSKYNDLDGSRNDMGIYGGQFGSCTSGQCKLGGKCYEQGTVFSEGRICWEGEIKQPQDEAGCGQVGGCWDSSVDRCFFSGTTRSDGKICQNSVWVDDTITPTMTQTSTPQPGDLQKPTVYSYLTTTYEDSQKVSGSKEAGTGIIVDGQLVVDIDIEDSWSHVFPLDNLGLNTFLIKAKNRDSQESAPLTLEIRRCVLADMNCKDQIVDISDLSLFIKSIKSNCKGGLYLGDLNHDGSCDVSDFELFKGEYLKYN